MSALLPAFLTVLTVGIGIIGTLLVVGLRWKIAIAVLIAIAGCGTFIQYYQSSRDAAFLKSALSTMLASMPNTQNFDDTMFSAAFAVSKRHGYYISQISKGEASELMYLTPEGMKGDTIGGILPIDAQMKGVLYVTYADQGDLQPIFEQAIFGTDETFGDSDKAHEGYLQQVSLLCQDALQDEIDRRGLKDAKVKGHIDFEKTVVECFSNPPNLSLRIGEDILKQMRPKPHGERYAEIAKYFSKQASGLPK